MKRLSLLLIITAGLLWGCKPSEKNYKEAYERTMARDSVRTEFNETVYGRFRRDVKEYRTVSNGDTADVRSTRVWVVPDEGTPNELMKKYCVVVGEFKQLLNARSMRDRFKDGGYPGAFIVQTPEPYYYVIAVSDRDLPIALSTIDKLKKESPLPLKSPTPYILVPSTLR